MTMDSQVAAERTQRIREDLNTACADLRQLEQRVEEIVENIASAVEDGIPEVMGYGSPIEWVFHEFNGALVHLSPALRRAATARLRGLGLSLRTIAEMTGVDPSTVYRDLSTTGEAARPERVLGTDGKIYPPRQQSSSGPTALQDLSDGPGPSGPASVSRPEVGEGPSGGRSAGEAPTDGFDVDELRLWAKVLLDLASRLAADLHRFLDLVEVTRGGAGGLLHASLHPVDEATRVLLAPTPLWDESVLERLERLQLLEPLIELLLAFRAERAEGA